MHQHPGVVVLGKWQLNQSYPHQVAWADAYHCMLFRLRRGSLYWHFNGKSISRIMGTILYRFLFIANIWFLKIAVTDAIVLFFCFCFLQCQHKAKATPGNFGFSCGLI